MDYDTLKLEQSMDDCERELEHIQKSIAYYTQMGLPGYARLWHWRRERLLGSVPLFGAYSHIKTKTTTFKL